MTFASKRGVAAYRANAKRAVTVLALTAALAGASGWEKANAFDFFGLWGSGDSPPPISNAEIGYAVTIDVAGGDAELASAIMDASSIYKLRHDAPPDGDTLARRAVRDFAPLIDALWGAGYYDASVTIAIDQAALTIGSKDITAFSRVADAYRNRAVAPIVIKVVPGALFKLRIIRILNGTAEFSRDELPQSIIGLKLGDPAVASDLRAAQARIVDHFRKSGHPFAKVRSIAPTVDHAAHVMDVAIDVAPGPMAPFGDATFVGPKTFDAAIARSFLYIAPGDPYSPASIDEAKASIREIPAVGSVRVTEGGALDAYGRLPTQFEVDDRLRHAIGVSAKYSTTDGPAAQAYWEDRNLFGGAERLRLQADLNYAPSTGGAGVKLTHLRPDDIGGRVSMSFLKPALGGSRNDLLIDAYGERVSTNSPRFVGYTANDEDLTIALRHRFNAELSVQAGIEAQRGVSRDALGKIDYGLIGVPVSATYDSTDSKLDPTRGVRLNASAVGFPTPLGSSLNLAQVKARASGYYSLDADSRFVLAGRMAFGTMSGPPLAAIPANWRFYSGGGGSVRGYAYDTLGPIGPGGAVVGGKSLFETSAELRVKLTQTIGVVPFFDAGNAFTSRLPNLRRPLQMSAGLGLRYFTAVGPIRLDIATPINPRRGDGRLAVYVSIGQAF